MHLETISNLLLLCSPNTCSQHCAGEKGTGQPECRQTGMDSYRLYQLYNSHTQEDVTVHEGLEREKN